MRSLILDFDQTIADTRALDALRRARDWSAVYRQISVIRIYPGVAELIAAAVEQGYKIGIVTNSPKSYCEAGLKFLQLQVDHITGYHDTARRKPYPDPIHYSLRQLNALAPQTLGLGDLPHDIQAYNAAGVRSVGCTWGCADRTALAAAGPAHLIDHPDELLNLL